MMRSKPLPRILLLLVLLGISLWLASCTPYLTRVDYDPAAGLTGLKTYAWVPVETTSTDPAVSAQYQTLDQARLRRAFDEALATKEMQLVAASDAQVWVDLTYAIDRRYETRTVFYGFYDWHPYWWGMEPETRIDERDESRLSLIMINPQTRSVIWTGQATVRYYEELPPLERTQRLVEQVKAIMARFPPR